jgi:hypothetical protein
MSGRRASSSPMCSPRSPRHALQRVHDNAASLHQGSLIVRDGDAALFSNPAERRCRMSARC